MKLRSITLAAVFAAALPGLAAAAPGMATGSVNLRTGPGTMYPVITTIPAGARVNVSNCGSWCRVSYAGYSGWASSGYISGNYRPAGPAYAPGPYTYRPMRPAYAPGPYRAIRPVAPTWGYYRKPWWDNRYGAWYDGRRWYFNGGWHDRPSGFSLNLGISGR